MNPKKELLRGLWVNPMINKEGLTQPPPGRPVAVSPAQRMLHEVQVAHLYPENPIPLN